MSRARDNVGRSVNNSGTEIEEQWIGECGVYPQGNSRVVTVPADVDCEVGDGVQTLVGKKNGRTVYVVMLLSSLQQQDELVARSEALKRSEATTDSRCGCNEIRSHPPSKVLTIPSQCEEGPFGDDTSQALFLGKIDGSVAYLKYVPPTYIKPKSDGAAI
jgi:hypothetical protein